jgi:hypothetical protein
MRGSTVLSFLCLISVVLNIRFFFLSVLPDLLETANSPNIYFTTTYDQHFHFTFLVSPTIPILYVSYTFFSIPTPSSIDRLAYALLIERLLAPCFFRFLSFPGMSCSFELTNHVPGIPHGLPSTCLFSAPWVGRRLEPRNSSPQLFEILGWILVVAGSCLPVIFSSLELTDSLLTQY